MNKTRLSGTSAVDDYFNSLLANVTQSDTPKAETESAVRFASVETGFELQPFWQEPLSAAQQLCANFTLLSCLRGISGRRLRQAMLQAIVMRRN